MDRSELERLWAEAGEPPEARAWDPATFMGATPRHAAEELLGADLVVLGLPLGGRRDAPAAVRQASRELARRLTGSSIRLDDYGDVAVDDGDLAATFVRAHDRLADIVASGAVPLVLGGGPLAALPALQVLAGKLHGHLGLVAFTPSVDLACEPAHAAASRWARVLELGVLEPRNFVLVGGWDAPDDARARHVLDGLGGRRFSAADVAETGVVGVAREALQAAGAGTEAVYVSVDLAVVAPEGDPAGLSVQQLVAALGVVADVRLAGADVSGAGAGQDAAAARLAAELVLAVAGQRA